MKQTTCDICGEDCKGYEYLLTMQIRVGRGYGEYAEAPSFDVCQECEVKIRGGAKIRLEE